MTITDTGVSTRVDGGATSQNSLGAAQSSVFPGGLIVVGAGWVDAAGTITCTSVTDTALNVYKPLTKTRNATQGYSVQLWYTYGSAAPVGGGANTITIHLSAVSTFLRVHVTEKKSSNGAWTFDPFDQQATATGNSLALATATITPTQNNELLVTLGSAAAGTITAGTGYVIHDAGGLSTGMADLVQTTAAAKAGLLTTSSSSQWGIAVASFKDAVQITARPYTPTFARQATPPTAPGGAIYGRSSLADAAAPATATGGPQLVSTPAPQPFPGPHTITPAWVDFGIGVVTPGPTLVSKPTPLATRGVTATVTPAWIDFGIGVPTGGPLLASRPVPLVADGTIVTFGPAWTDPGIGVTTPQPVIISDPAPVPFPTPLSGRSSLADVAPPAAATPGPQLVSRPVPLVALGATVTGRTPNLDYGAGVTTPGPQLLTDPATPVIPGPPITGRSSLVDAAAPATTTPGPTLVTYRSATAPAPAPIVSRSVAPVPAAVRPTLVTLVSSPSIVAPGRILTGRNYLPSLATVKVPGPVLVTHVFKLAAGVIITSRTNTPPPPPPPLIQDLSGLVYGDPGTHWRSGGPADRWTVGDPALAWSTGAPAPHWTEDRR